MTYLNTIHTGDAVEVLRNIPGSVVDLSVFSPPYFVGKDYEAHMDFPGWKNLLQGVVIEHGRVLKSGAFMVINISDILCFSDKEMPRFMADNVSNKKIAVSREEILAIMKRHPKANRREVAKILGCSEQTIQRRIEHNNVRGGKTTAGTKVYVVGGLLQEWAESAGLYLYDRRVWHKDPCWANSRWHSNSYRAVDEFEYLYIFWKPGIVRIDRGRLGRHEWAEWGSRGVWRIPSVRRNAEHEAAFPEQLVERVIRLFSTEGDTVLDPFVGSGTTTSVARRLNRNYVGIERLPKYAALAELRTNKSAPITGAAQRKVEGQ